MTTPGIAVAAARLARLLEAENAALASLDFAAAARLGREKANAVEALVSAVRADPSPVGASSAAQSNAGQSQWPLAQADGAARRAIAALPQLAQRNRELLEQALAVQRRVIAIVARAIQRREPAEAYRASGRALAAEMLPVALRAQA